MNEDPYDAGYAAWNLGQTAHDNPHEPGTEAHEDWKGGWNDAAIELGEEEE